MEISWEELNQAAMQIILHAGDARTLIMKAVNLVCEHDDINAAQDCLKEAKKLLEKGHQIQTDYIQKTVANENQKPCLLFNHAQDTLMVIYSEQLMVKNMLKLYIKTVER